MIYIAEQCTIQKSPSESILAIDRISLSFHCSTTQFDVSSSIVFGEICQKVSKLISHYFTNDGEILSIAYFDSPGHEGTVL